MALLPNSFPSEHHGPLVLTIDVEDWVDSFIRLGPLPAQLVGQPPRLAYCLPPLLQLLSDCRSKATFFVLGRAARQVPELIRSIASAGHEVACHGWEHRSLACFSPRLLLEELRRARALLQGLSGQPVRGFRAPWFSLTASTAWTGDVIAEAGFDYDSSLFPASMLLYGDSSFPRGPHRLACGLLEVPPAVTAVGGFRLPVAGGVYWRVLPGSLVRWGVRRLRAEGLPAVLYTHPWEFDRGRPWVWVDSFANLVHYVRIQDPAHCLRELLATGPSGSIESTLLLESAFADGPSSEAVLR